MDYCFYNMRMNGVNIETGTFDKCNALESIEGIFSNWSNNGSTAWNFTLPLNLFKQYDANNGKGQRLKNVGSAFAKCAGLKGDPIKFWDGTFISLSKYAECYAYCDGLTGYSDGGIPTSYGGGK